jgi:hypothetical protein
LKTALDLNMPKEPKEYITKYGTTTMEIKNIFIFGSMIIIILINTE